MTEKKLNLRLLKDTYGVCRLNKDDSIPSWAFDGEFFSITKTNDELSIVCLENNIPSDIKYEKFWKILKIEGPLDFSLVGILSKISSLMAENNISIFAISTYDTDYILIKKEKIDSAVNILEKDLYNVIR